MVAGPAARGEPVDLRLRIAWGGGAARRWLASVSVSQGQFSDPAPLGLEADVPGSIEVSGRHVRLSERTAHVYDGLDIQVAAPLDATLSLTLTPLDGPVRPYREQLPLSSLLSGLHTAQLDEHGNSIVVRRAPGDRLRLSLKRQHLVFAPGETAQLVVEPHLVGLRADSQYDCHVRLLRGRSDEELWSTAQQVRTDEAGELPLLGPFQIELPATEGVYDVVVGLTPTKRFTTPFNRAKPVLQRMVQLVVVDPHRPPAEAVDWQVDLEIDPAKAGWWDRIKQLPQLHLIPGFGKGPLGNDRADTHTWQGRRFVRLQPGGWQAYPLPVRQPGQPHVLEIELPGDLAQSLAISIIEPNAAGAVLPLGLDSGVEVPDRALADDVPLGPLRHRLVFWPRTSSPLVLLLNQREDGPAAFGKLRLLSGPHELPPARAAAPADHRLLAAYFDRPLLAENFGAGEALDPWSHQTRDDWQTFYLGGRRLTEYLQYAGYNGTVLSVWSDGSAIYPSRRLQSTPKYDSGTFFITAQDPVRKDVLEMLLRLFDRTGLTLIPALRFSSPLPALEQLLRHGGEERVGIEPVNDQGASWLSLHDPRQGEAPYYNPLDPRVQQAMVDVVAELAERYAHHPSFGGVALQLGPYTYAQLPGQWWCYDERTIRRFEEQTGIKLESSAEQPAARAALLQGKWRKQWLQWRAEQLTGLYRSMLQAVQQQRPDARLYLAAAQSLASPEMYAALHPRLPPRSAEEVAGAWLQIGIAPELLHQEPNLVLLRPHRDGPGLSLRSQAIDLDLNFSPELDQLFGAAPHPGGFCLYTAQSRTLPAFDRQSPFGADQTQTWLLPHLTPAGALNRQRLVHHLATLDAQTIVDGGWLLRMGQEDALRPFTDVFCRLPAERFEQVRPKHGTPPVQGVTVRRLSQGAQTYVYLVNDSPWPAVVHLELEAPAGCQATSLGSRPVSPLEAQGGQYRWRVALQPYDLLGATLNKPDVQITDWTATVQGEPAERLRRQLADVEGRFNALSNPSPMGVVENAGFEEPLQHGRIVGWQTARGPDVDVSVQSDAHHGGRQSLRLAVKQPGAVAWVRSRPFDPPATGRVAVFVWLKTDDPDHQPALRLAIEGRLKGQVYYKFALVGQGGQPLGDQWVQFIFRLDDLPPVGLTGLRVGFDLMSPGTVWVDDVQVFDRWFDPDRELDELLKTIALAKFQLAQGEVVQCYQFLQSYWARFLLHHVPPPPRLAQVPRPARPAPPPKPADEPQKPSMLQRMKSWLPKKLLPF